MAELNEFYSKNNLYHERSSYHRKFIVNQRFAQCLIKYKKVPRGNEKIKGSSIIN